MISHTLIEEIEKHVKGDEFSYNDEWWKFDYPDTFNVNLGEQGGLFAIGYRGTICKKLKFFLIQEWR